MEIITSRWWLEKRKSGSDFKRNPKRPFFLWIDSFDPHEPWDPPSVWDPDLKCPYDPDYEGNPLLLAPWSDVKGRITDRECRHVRALTAEKITVVDKWVGKLLDQIQQMGLMDDTLIIVCSDHGQPMGEGEHGHGIMRKSRPWPYEELVHIPLMMHVPGVKGGRRIKSFVQDTDIMPTVLDALGYLDEEALREAGHEGIRNFRHDGHSRLQFIAGCSWRKGPGAGLCHCRLLRHVMVAHN